MAEPTFDIVIIGAGSGGLTAAAFAARLGAKTALIEKAHIGGDCTWTGCVPSKAMLRAARVAHEIRTAARYGIDTNPPVIDMRGIRDYVRSAISDVYQHETPEALQQAGIDVIIGRAQFLDPHTVQVERRRIRGSVFLITTGGHALIPPIGGLERVRYLTYEKLFESDRLPATLAIIGSGPIGMEMAQAYQRLGTQVTITGERILPRDEPEARETMRKVFEREGVRFVFGRAKTVRQDGNQTVTSTTAGEIRTEMLLLAAGRRPAVSGLDLEKAGVDYSAAGIRVDNRLRTSVKHIYAAGDVVGGYQFTHLAGWQAFQAVRNALLPGNASGFAADVPWVTYTDPEVAHTGLTEEQARQRFGGGIGVHTRPMSMVDRAVCENDRDGFIKIVTKRNGAIVGATMVASRAGEAISEMVFAVAKGWRLTDIAGTIHPYPTYSTAIQQLAAETTHKQILSGIRGRLLRAVSRMIR